MLPLYGGADFAIPFPPVCGSADNPPPVLSAKISASVLFRSYSTSPFGNRIWRKKTAHTIKFLPYQNPFWGFTPNPTREIISLGPLYLRTNIVCAKNQVKGMMPLQGSGDSVPREEKGLLYPSRCSVSSTSNASTSFTSGFFCMKLFSVYWFANSRIGRSKWS